MPEPIFFWRPIPERKPQFEGLFAAKSLHAFIVPCAVCMWAMDDDNRPGCAAVMRSWENASSEQRAKMLEASHQRKEAVRQFGIWHEYRKQMREELDPVRSHI